MGAQSTARWSIVRAPIQNVWSGYPRHWWEKVINEYEVNGILFDDFKNGKLFDYKDNYSKLINKQGEFYDWFQGKAELRDQALRQVGAANGTPVVWKVGANQVQAFKTAVGDVPGLTIVP